MANTIDIEVNLDSKDALKGLDKLEGAGEAVGETFGSMGEAVGKMGGDVNEQLGAIGETASGLSGSFMELSEAAATPGASFMSLLGPIGAVMIAVIELGKAFDDYSGKSQEAEIQLLAQEAAAAELTAAVEELSAAQVELNDKQIDQLEELSMLAKVPLEVSQNIREANAERKVAIAQMDRQIKQAAEFYRMQPRMVQTQDLYDEGPKARSLREKREKLQRKVDAERKRALEFAKVGAKKFAEFEEAKEELLKTSPEFRKKIAEQELRIQEDAEIISLQSASDSAKSQAEVAIIQSTRKIREIKAMEDISSKARDKAIRAESIRLGDQIAKIEKAQAEKRAQARQVEQTKRLIEEQRLQQELFMIRSLEIQHLRVSGATALELLDAQHQLEIDKAGQNANLKLMADMKYEIGKTQLIKTEEEKRLALEAKAQAKSQALAEKRHQEFMAQMKEQNQIIADQIESGLKTIPIVGELADSFGGAFAQASYGALAMGESFEDAVTGIIHGLGKQAALQAMMETAKGVAALILNPAVAATHFKSAAIFGGAAVLAGVSANAIDGGGGGGGASPSGAPQTAPTPQRETAQETSTVFNVNFGGAVIYDTKQAAERAMVDRIVGVMNQRNRGSRRLNLGRV